MYIWDLENTLSNSEHRNELALAKKFDQFHALFYKDEPRANNVRLYEACRKQHTTVILTGMMEKHRNSAITWLHKHKLMPDILLMRQNNDFRSSPEFKVSTVQYMRYHPFMIFDDREDVVDAFLRAGMPAVMVAS